MEQKLKKILIVEDEAAIADMYSFKLSHGGYTTKHAFDGQHGLELAEEFKPDLILLDLRMPIMTGDEMLRKLRATEWGSSMRVIILTNYSRTEAPSDLRFLNVDRYILKAHHTPAQIVKIVDEVLSSSDEK